MRQFCARTLTLIILVAAAACGPRPTDAPTPTLTPAVTEAPPTAAATATSAPTLAPTDAPPVATLPPTATSAPTAAPLVAAPADPCAEGAAALAPELTLSYTGPRSDGLGGSIYLVRGDGTQPAEFVQGAFAGAWSPNGQWLAYLTGIGDATQPYILHLVMDDGSHPQDIPLDVSIDPDHSLYWSPDGHYLALIGSAGIYVVDIQSGQLTNVAGDLPGASGAVWSPDSSRLAFQAPKNLELGNENHVYTARPDGSDRVEVVAETINDYAQDWTSDGTQLLIRAGANATAQQVYLVSLDGSSREALFGGQTYADYMTYSPNDQKLAFLAGEQHLDAAGNITGASEWLTLADANGANPHTLQALELGFGERGLSAPQWSPNGRYVAFQRGVPDANPDLMVADICTDALTQVASNVSGRFSWKAGPPVTAVTAIVATAPEVVPTAPPLGDAATQLAWTPDGQTLAAVTTAGARFYDPATGAERTILPASATCCGFSAFDGQYLASISGGGTGLTVYDWQTQQVIFSLADQPAEQIQSVAFSPDGTRMAVGERFQLRLYELPSGNLIETFQTAEVADSYVVAVGFTADGGTLVSVTQWEGIVQVWDVDALTLRRTVRIPTVTRFTLLPGARQLAADYAKPGFDLWEPATGFLLGKHPDIVSATGFSDFSSDNRRVAVWGYKNADNSAWTLAVWDIPNNRQVFTRDLDAIQFPTDEYRDAALSPDGTRLAISDAAGNIWVYETDTWTQVTSWAVAGSAAQP